MSNEIKALDNEITSGNHYGGILKITRVADVTVDSFDFVSHWGHGTYDIFIFWAINLTFNNCLDKKFDDYNRWGIWGGNYMKDIVVNKVKLNRIDAHCGVWNLTINNSTLGNRGIPVVGGGLLKVTNTKFVEADIMIEFRTDYGATWNGIITLDNITFTPNNSTSPAYLIKGYNPGNWYFGYDTYFPKISINNLTVNGKNTKNVYAFGYAQDSKKYPYTFSGDISLNNVKSNYGIRIFDDDFTNKYLNKSSHDDKKLINIPLTDVKLREPKTDIAECKKLGANCKFKFKIN